MDGTFGDQGFGGGTWRGLFLLSDPSCLDETGHGEVGPSQFQEMFGAPHVEAADAFRLEGTLCGACCGEFHEGALPAARFFGLDGGTEIHAPRVASKTVPFIRHTWTG